MVLYEIVELIKMFSLYDKTRRVAYVLYLISFIMCVLSAVYGGEKLENLFAYIHQPQNTYNEPLPHAMLHKQSQIWTCMRVYNGARLEIPQGGKRDEHFSGLPKLSSTYIASGV